MKIHFGGICKDFEALPMKNNPEDAVMFREPSDSRKFALLVNVGAILLMLPLLVPYFCLGKPYFGDADVAIYTGLIASLISAIPHEFLHAVCFRKDAGIYLYPKGNALFVYGMEDMSKTRFIIMNLLPNIVFGWIPYLVFLFHPDMIGLGLFGLINTGGGFGDYFNVFNAITQVPANSWIYLAGIHTFWHPKGSTGN